MQSDEGSPYTPDRSWAPSEAVFLRFVDLERHPDFEFMVVGLDRDLSWASFRPVRHGGYAPADRAMQQQLYLLVGAITVAGAHAETDMKRILLANDPDTTKHYADTHERWSDLMKALRTLAHENGQEALQEVLAWADEHDLDEIRNAAVHGYWWLYDVGHAHRGRIRGRRAIEQETAQFGTWEDLAQHADTMFEFAARLQSIVPWPTAVLPPLEHPGFLNERVRLPQTPDVQGRLVKTTPPTG